ncbi:MAG TPA: GHMP kinase [Chloroflexota bacterium]|nr:GHMP kinase [Chloroflexota bacterium]
MLIARAPFRISFAGGGTDLPAYYEQFGGCVVSTTIDKYVYVHIGPNGTNGAQITSADYHTFYRYQGGTTADWNGELALPRAVLHEMEVDEGIALFLASEVPPGTGLGSSSALAVAMVQAIAAWQGRSLSRQAIAELACRVELQKLQAPIGKQDQFAAAFGGLNAISFTRNGVTVEPIRVSSSVREQLERRLMLFFTGTAHNSAVILKEQQRASAAGSPSTIQGLHRIKAAAAACRACLESGDLDGIGLLLDEGWREKRKLVAGITNQRIDEVYELARDVGALGGKITGAGGGGFLLLYCHEVYQEALTEEMEKRGLRRMDFHFDQQGVTLQHVAWNGVTRSDGIAAKPEVTQVAFT